jgi:SPP1 family phage portal protein
MGRMPLTEIHNNEEEQGDFEQVIPLLKDRSTVHDLNIEDMTKIAKNYLQARNIAFAGKTADEKAKNRDEAAKLHLIEVRTGIDATGQSDPNDGINMLSKPENYSSVDVFGKDIDSKIYDLTMIPDLSSEQFAGNQTGVALELKLMPFKKMVEAKDVFIQRMYRRRLKMYAYALNKRGGFALFDAAECGISINRDWTTNLFELAQMISTLSTTGLFSDETLVKLMPDVDYETEKKRKEQEQKDKQAAAMKNPNINNAANGYMSQFFGGSNPKTETAGAIDGRGTA